jgi:hypothetical protein
MRKELFDELLESVREGGEILRGKQQPARAFTIDEPVGSGPQEPPRSPLAAEGSPEARPGPTLSHVECSKPL